MLFLLCRHHRLINIMSILFITNSIKILISHRQSSLRCHSRSSTLLSQYTSIESTMTPVVVKPHGNKIFHSSKVFLIGSCFSEVVSREMRLRKFDICSNPRGIVFNPMSVADTIKDCVSKRLFSQLDVFQDANDMKLFHSWDHHSIFSSTHSADMISQMNQSQTQSRSFLEHCDFILITLGSAFVHKLKTNGRVVANCHKREL